MTQHPLTDLIVIVFLIAVLFIGHKAWTERRTSLQATRVSPMGWTVPFSDPLVTRSGGMGNEEPIGPTLLTTSSDNVALGYQALQSITTGTDNTAIGRYAVGASELRRQAQSFIDRGMRVPDALQIELDAVERFEKQQDSRKASK